MKKSLFIFISVMLVVWGVGGNLLSPKSALAMTINPGTLIKAPSSSAVYYVTEGNQKYVFPDSYVFNSWFKDFSTVQTVTEETLQNYQTSGNVKLRAGTYLAQFVALNGDGSFNIDDPKVYAITSGGVKHWITTAEIAQSLYGSDWAMNIHAIPITLISDYAQGSDINSIYYPEGSLVKNSGNPTVYYINASGQKQEVTANGFSSNLFQDQYVVNTNICLTCYPAGESITAASSGLITIINTPIVSAAHTYYVATNGNDYNGGTISNPLRTISKAAELAGPGDIIYIRGGTYDEMVKPPNSGTAGNLITFTAYPNENVIVRGVGTGYVFYLDEVNYIKINGLTIKRGLGGSPYIIPEYKPYKSETIAHGAGIKIFHANYNVITNNNIYDNDIGIFVSEGGISMENLFPSQHNEIINNQIHQSGEAGIRIKRSDYTTVDSNTVYNNGIQGNNVYSEPAAGITYYCSIGTNLSNNRVYGNSSSAIDNYAGTNQDTCISSATLISDNILSQTLSRDTTNYLYANKKIVLIISEKEALDTNSIYKNNTFYNGTLGSDIVTWGVNNINTVGEAVTLSEFNSLTHTLNSESGVGNVQVTTNPF